MHLGRVQYRLLIHPVDSLRLLLHLQLNSLQLLRQLTLMSLGNFWWRREIEEGRREG
jgi:hypothetical protein